MWLVYSLLAAVFAALVAILARLGLEGVNSHVAVAVRTVVVLVMAWALVFITGHHGDVFTMTRRNWIFLIASGVATGLSWLFFFRALQIGDVSRVVPIDKLSVVLTIVLAFVIFREEVNWRTILGGVLVTAGTVLLAI